MSTPRRRKPAEPYAVKVTETSTVPITYEMAEMLDDRELVKFVADHFEKIDGILARVQGDLTHDGNLATAGYEAHGIKKARQAFYLFRIKGQASAKDADNKAQ